MLSCGICTFGDSYSVSYKNKGHSVVPFKLEPSCASQRNLSPGCELAFQRYLQRAQEETTRVVLKVLQPFKSWTLPPEIEAVYQRHLKRSHEILDACALHGKKSRFCKSKLREISSKTNMLLIKIQKQFKSQYRTISAPSIKNKSY